MEDSAILELYWARDEGAIAATQAKYGALCKTLAEHIAGPEDAEECFNDALHRLWDTIPPQRPRSLRAYLCRIVRNLALDRWRAGAARKRGGAQVLISELEDCLPAPGGVEEAAEAGEIAACLDRWLAGLGREDRICFLRRYWYGDSLAELAARWGGTPQQMAQRLLRLRRRLRRALEKEGVNL